MDGMNDGLAIVLAVGLLVFSFIHFVLDREKNKEASLMKTAILAALIGVGYTLFILIIRFFVGDVAHLYFEEFLKLMILVSLLVGWQPLKRTLKATSSKMKKSLIICWGIFIIAYSILIVFAVFSLNEKLNFYVDGINDILAVLITSYAAFTTFSSEKTSQTKENK